MPVTMSAICSERLDRAVLIRLACLVLVDLLLQFAQLHSECLVRLHQLDHVLLGRVLDARNGGAVLTGGLPTRVAQF